jgi:hypothetical protein
MLNQEHTPKHTKQKCVMVGGQMLNQTWQLDSMIMGTQQFLSSSFHCHILVLSHVLIVAIHNPNYNTMISFLFLSMPSKARLFY